MAFNYANMFRPYAPAAMPYRPVPYAQNLLSLYRPYFSGFGVSNVPPGPGGGVVQPPVPYAVPRIPAPQFIGAAFGTGSGAAAVANPGPAGSGGGGSGAGAAIAGKANAYADSIEEQARAARLAAMKQDLIRFGDPDLVMRTLGGKQAVYKKGPLAGQNRGTYKWAGVQQATAANPFSTTKELGRWNDRSNVGVNEARNQSGLYYSSTRARDLALQGEDFLRQKSKAANDFQDAINQIEQQYIQAMLQAQSVRLQGAQSAYSAGG